MARGNCTFKQRDVTAALKAVAAAGMFGAIVEIDTNGRIRIITVSGPGDGSARASDNEWDSTT